MDATIADASSYLQMLSTQIPEHIPASDGLSVTWSVAIDSDIAESLLTAADNGASGIAGAASSHEGGQPYDFIALATHGRTGLARWAIGSVTERVLQATRLPLLIVRGPADAMAESPFADPLLGEEIEGWPGAE